jgi:hypothetical protein
MISTRSGDTFNAASNAARLGIVPTTRGVPNHSNNSVFSLKLMPYPNDTQKIPQP